MDVMVDGGESARGWAATALARDAHASVVDAVRARRKATARARRGGS